MKYFANLFERSGKNNIADWIDFQELKLQLMDDGVLSFKRQTTEERRVLQKRLHINKRINHQNNKVCLKYYEK